MDDLKVKALLRDPAFWVAAVPIVAAFSPSTSAWIEAHRAAFIPLAVVIGGHFGVRMSAVKAMGLRADAEAFGLPTEIETNAPTGEPGAPESLED
jgi:hypothetical protein